MYLVSLYFDEKSNRTLQMYIDRVARATGNEFMLGKRTLEPAGNGFMLGERTSEPSGNEFMTVGRVPPHLTVSAIEARGVEVLVPAFESLKGKLGGGRIQVVSVGQLLPRVIYGGVVLNDYLMDVAGSVYEAFEGIPETTVSRFYRPGSWLPHITIGKTLDQVQMRQAFEVMQDQFVPFTAEVVRIGLAKVNPHEEVASIVLAKVDPR